MNRWKNVLYVCGFVAACVLPITCAWMYQRLDSSSDGMDERKESSDDREQISTDVFMSEKYPYANDQMIYISLEEGSVEQWSLEGEYIQSISMPSKEFDSEDLLWVDNEEIIWSSWNKNDTKQTIWSTAIQQTKNGEQLRFDQSEKVVVLSENKAMYGSDPALLEAGQVYVDNEKIVYLSAGNVFVYDRVAGKKPIKVNSQTDGYVLTPKDGLFVGSEICNNYIVFHTGRRTGEVLENAYDFWCYDIKSDQLQRIDDRCFCSAAYVADSERDKVYYQIIEDQSIWEYDCQTGEKKELISEATFQNCYEKNQLVWDEAYYNDNLFVEGETLYFIKSEENPRIFSYSFLDHSIFYERELTESVRRSGFCTAGISNWLSIYQGKLFLQWENWDEDSIYYICMDLETGKSKVVTKTDLEKIYFGMVGLWEESGTTGEWKESELEPDENEKEGSLSIQDQLALICEQFKIWQKDGEEFSGFYQYFAITDLDHNGKLEVIASSGTQGSGAFTSSYYYQVSADGKSLRPCYASEGTESFDIVWSIKTVYIDQSTNTYYYPVRDYVSAGAGYRDTYYGALVLKDGMLTDRIYATAAIRWDKKKEHEVCRYYSRIGGKKKKIKANEFDYEQLADEFWDGLVKEKVKVSWFHVPEGKKLTKKQIKKKVERSYQEFSKETK